MRIRCGGKRLCTVLLLWAVFFSIPAGIGHSQQAATPNDDQLRASASCQEMLTLVKAHQKFMERDLRRLHRELAMLEQQIQEPGLREIFGGLGYILGLFGVAFYVYAQRRLKEAGKDS